MGELFQTMNHQGWKNEKKKIDYSQLSLSAHLVFAILSSFLPDLVNSFYSNKPLVNFNFGK